VSKLEIALRKENIVINEIQKKDINTAKSTLPKINLDVDTIIITRGSKTKSLPLNLSSGLTDEKAST
jgi:hypothetical protein